MHWDGSVSLGNIITVGVFLLTIYTLHIKNVERLVKIETRVEVIWKTLKFRLGMNGDDE